MSRWRRQQRRRARLARAQHDLETGATERRARALEQFERFEREHPVRARRWLQVHGRDRVSAALAAAPALTSGALST